MYLFFYSTNEENEENEPHTPYTMPNMLDFLCFYGKMYGIHNDIVYIVHWQKTWHIEFKS